jgi:hypothetical protein
MSKLTGKALAFFQRAGRRGAKAHAAKYGSKQRKQWASLGGRPRERKTLLILEALKSGPKSRLEISKATKLDLGIVSATLERLSRIGEVVHSARGNKRKNSGKWEFVHDTTAKSEAENQNGQ